MRIRTPAILCPLAIALSLAMGAGAATATRSATGTGAATGTRSATGTGTGSATGTGAATGTESATGTATATGTGADTPRASLTDIEADVMCVSCHEPLALAQSPQAFAERNYIRSLIAQGQSKAEIETALVAQYGQAVLGRPPARGFNLTVYVLPPALVLAGLAMLAITLPRWRRRARASAGRPVPAGPSLAPDDARRLDEDLARYE